MTSHTKPSIRLSNISKCYRIFQNPQDRFKQALWDRFPAILKRNSSTQLYREHWALRDVSFEVFPGEAVGILGRNGAGKSTLLQIISGTLSPTSGEVETSGRITALLELGSGFNPEFTGRENVFHNAQILGLSKEETLNKFDDIAAFADIGDFLDQPVKTYSSGMMMRLAFAVQTAVEPQILIVDEALSVGDMFFQAKCMARINKLVDTGVALLFVSHDIGTIRQLCNKAVLLENGLIRSSGHSSKVSDEYVKLQLEDRNIAAGAKTVVPVGKNNLVSDAESYQNSNKYDSDLNETLLLDMEFGKESFLERASYNRISNGDAEFINVQMLVHNQHNAEFQFDDEVCIKLYVRFYKNLSNLNVSLKIRTLQGTDIAFFDTRLQEKMTETYYEGNVYVFEWKLRLPILHGLYAIACALAHPPIVAGEDWKFVDVVPHAYEFRMAPRINGMIDGFVTWPVSLDIGCIGAIA